jgi:hypothetical protein
LGWARPNRVGPKVAQQTYPPIFFVGWASPTILAKPSQIGMGQQRPNRPGLPFIRAHTHTRTHTHTHTHTQVGWTLPNHLGWDGTGLAHCPHSRWPSLVTTVIIYTIYRTNCCSACTDSTAEVRKRRKGMEDYVAWGLQL